ncbi:MarR family winged helix-turn-helix transcriptional regulator [Streptomyces sp. TS71-3]|uniref:MarR family winged helix-turn-helix transcriptional regulator n=1 Tax=Streptomyces sp. TS71-3 TaxID=2733862 RepID=UPI001B1F50FB|nr:MarR family transcriptional regulator [Streptomyces sp. TS71-3]GHJ37493.1 putative HTH-type transcriptional regulator [Streptomyces sp. TS71-3]
MGDQERDPRHGDPDPGDLAAYLRPRFLRISQAMRRDTQGLAVTITQGAVLSLLRAGPCGVGELARAEGVRPPSMTQIVNRMIELGWVTRSGPAVRGSQVEITELGQKVWADVTRERVALLAARVEALSADDQRTLRAALPVLDRLFGPPIS